MIKLRDIFLLENRFLMLIGGTYDMHRGKLDGEFMEMLPALAPVVTLTESFYPFIATTEDDSEVQTYTIAATNIFGDLKIVAPTGYRISTDDITYTQSLNLVNVDGEISFTIYVKLLSGAVGTVNGNIVHTATGFSENLAVTGAIYQDYDIVNVVYGFLYNWFATQDQGGGVYITSDAMRAEGWDVPTDANLTTLATYLTEAEAGGKLKEIGLTYWTNPNDAATNEVDFNGRGSGERFGATGAFDNLKGVLYLWTKTAEDGTAGYQFSIVNSEGGTVVGLYKSSSLNETGHSLRPVRPATEAEQLLPDGILTGVYYIGNDGKYYRVTKIGTQVWVADNLCETKFSDGSDIVSDDNLQGYWTFNEASGDALDYSGNGNTGTLTGGVTRVTGVIGNAVELDGTNGYIDLGINSSVLGINGANARTISIWVYAKRFNFDPVFSVQLSETTNKEFSLRCENVNNNWRFITYNDDITFTLDSLNKWVHFAITYNGTKAIVYANGAIVGQADMTLDTDDAPVLFGKRLTRYFQGLLDEARIYNRALTQDEVTQLYNLQPVYGGISNANWAALTTAALCAYNDDEDNVLTT
jgi:uncharacterized protein (TIGR02145 family)